MPIKKRINKPTLQIGGGAKQKRKLKDSPYFHYALILLILALLFVPLYYLQSGITGFAILQNLFGGESSKVLTFTEAGNQTDYFKLPENANVTSSRFTLQGLAYSVASLFQTLTQSDFNEGTYNQTEYNITNNAVQLNLSYDSGNYTSKILDTGGTSSYQNLSWNEQRIQCPEGMAYINKLNGFCIDKYEAHALNSDGSEATPPQSAGDTDTLIAAGGKAGSALNKTVWVYIDQTEARTACSNAGKHLCTDEEWLAASNMQGEYYNLPTDLAVSPYYCVTGSTTYCLDNSPGSGEACQTGCNVNGCPSGCYSSEGVYDMTGNVWEWTNETVDVTNPDGTAGWKYANSTGGWQTSTSSATAIYGNDGVYFPTTTTGRAVRRGGDWYVGAEAGPFCASLADAPSATNNGIGFRCCSS